MDPNPPYASIGKDPAGCASRSSGLYGWKPLRASSSDGIPLELGGFKRCIFSGGCGDERFFGSPPREASALRTRPSDIAFPRESLMSRTSTCRRSMEFPTGLPRPSEFERSWPPPPPRSLRPPPTPIPVSSSFTSACLARLHSAAAKGPRPLPLLAAAADAL